MNNSPHPDSDPRTQFWARRINRAFVAPKHWWTAPNTSLGLRSPCEAAMQGDIAAVENLIARQENAIAILSNLKSEI